MSQLQRAIAEFRQSLINREQDTATTIYQAYVNSYLSISVQLDNLLLRISEAKNISEHWLYQEVRFITLMSVIEREMSVFAAFAESQTVIAAREAISFAKKDALELIKVSFPEDQLPFLKFNPASFETTLARLSDGSPVADLFSSISQNALVVARDILTEGVVKGSGPRVIAKEFEEKLNISAVRALTIARTEVLGAYREASIQTYRDNKDVVDRWRWSCEFGPRTCAMCIAMDGKEFPLSEPFGSHPNCRCSPVPVTKSWEDLGISGVEDNRTSLQSGKEWFDSQPLSTQREILGPSKLSLYHSGRLTLDDLIGFRVDNVWGPVRWERSLKELGK